MMPKTFSLVNRQWRVRVVTSKQLRRHLETHWADDEELLNTAGNLKGLCDPDASRIFINKDSHTTQEDMEHTYFHELVHALLYAEGIDSHGHDEAMVDRIGGFLHQIERSKKC
jgi:Zn-dependent peptidase ImmA (M78 family)|tara:strand:+ start:2462 stop:2800 length:339 start_codon:yes stop_codon:yes gene_type:complete